MSNFRSVTKEVGVAIQNLLSETKKPNHTLKLILQRLFAIDVRSLALFRICIGVVLLADLLSRSTDSQLHYSDLGVLPREALWQLFLLSKWHWSLHALTGSVAGQSFLFLCAIVCTIALILGYRTRYATVLSWILLASLQARNPILQYGGDHLLRMLLFWSIFLPLGCHWSIDRLCSYVQQSQSHRHLSMASAAILLQMFIVYFFANLFKRNEVWQSGEAITRAFSNDMFSKPLAHHLLEYPQLLEQISHLIPWFQFLLPFMLFVPWRTMRFRSVAILLIVGFNMAIELLLATGIFQYVALSGMILFLPSEFWHRLATMYKAHSVIQSIANTMRTKLPSVLERKPQPQSEPQKKWTYAAVQVLVFCLLIYVLAWNIATLKVDEYARQNSMSWMSEGSKGKFIHRQVQLDYAVERMFGNFGWLGRIAKLHQHWAMFQWGGGTINGWHVIAGTLNNGQVISLLEGGAPLLDETYRKPYPVLELYPNARWRIYFLYLRFASSLRTYLPGAISRNWNKQHPDLQITKLKISSILDSVESNGQTPKRQEFIWYEGPAL